MRQVSFHNSANMVAEQRGCTPRTGAEPDDRERISELSIEERDSLSITHKDAVGSRRAAWGISTNVEQKEMTKVHQKKAADARKYAAKVCDGILTLIDENLIPSASRGELKVFYYKTDVPVPRVMEEQASKLNDRDELIPKWLNVVKGVVDSEDLPVNVHRETLLQNKILRVIKKNHVTKYLEMLAEIAELKDDDYKKFYEQFDKRLSLGIHMAELSRFNTSKSREEQISFEGYVDCMREGQNDTYCITDESTTVVSSSSFRENFRKKGYEILYMADPVDELPCNSPRSLMERS